MAETIHRIVEKIEVQGGAQAASVFERLAKSAGHSGSGIGRAAGGIEDALARIEAKSQSVSGGFGHMSQSAGALAVGLAEVGGPVGELVARGIDAIGDAAHWAAGKIEQFAREGWALNDAYDALKDPIAGNLAVMTKLSKIKDPFARMDVAGEAAEGLLRANYETAFKTGEALDHVAQLGARIQPIWFAAGKSAYDVASATDDVASAAKVLGVSLEDARTSVERLVRTGKAGRLNDPFGLAIKGQSHLKATDKWQTRLEKIVKTTHEIGSAVKSVASDTSDQVARLDLFVDDIKRRGFAPIYEVAGKLVGSLVEYAHENQKQIDEMLISFSMFVEQLGESVAQTKDLAVGLWDAARGGFALYKAMNPNSVLNTPGQALSVLDQVDAKLKSAGKFAHAVLQLSGVGGEKERSTGKAKLDDFLEALKTPAQKVDELEEKRSRLFLGLPSGQAGPPLSLAMIRDMNASLNAQREALLTPGTQIDASKFGPPSPSKSELMVRNFKAALEKALGNKTALFEQHIDKIEIRQDFRDQDPDRVLVEFTQGLQRLGEAALQSTVGGAATQFGPG